MTQAGHGDYSVCRRGQGKRWTAYDRSNVGEPAEDDLVAIALSSERSEAVTEQEYIDATNLAKLRTAKTIVWDCLPMREDEQVLSGEILQALRKWIEKLEPIVSPDPQEGSDAG